jgi:hypothetical protein
MKKQKLQFIADHYQKVRGGWFRFLNLYCVYCGYHIMLYQKDSPGSLMRFYPDCIVAPAELAGRQYKQTVPNVTCSHCGRLLGIPGVYDDETRRAIFWQACVVRQRVGVGVYPPRVEKINYKLP